MFLIHHAKFQILNISFLLQGPQVTSKPHFKIQLPEEHKEVDLALDSRNVKVSLEGQVNSIQLKTKLITIVNRPQHLLQLHIFLKDDDAQSL